MINLDTASDSEVMQLLKDARPTQDGMGQNWVVDQSMAVQVNRQRNIRQGPAPFNMDQKSSSGIVGQLDAITSTLSDTITTLDGVVNTIPIAHKVTASTSISYLAMTVPSGQVFTRTVSGATVGGVVALDWSSALPAGVYASAMVSSLNNVMIELVNYGPLEHPAGSRSLTIQVTQVTYP